MRASLEVSAGELIDRITILELKCARLPEIVRVEVMRELSAAIAERDRTLPRSGTVLELTEALRSVNRDLWQVEEELRACERDGEFGARFVELARSVYRTNDQRASLKRRIDELVGSEVREHKSHAGIHA